MASSKQLSRALVLALLLSAGSTYVLGKRLLRAGTVQATTRHYLSPRHSIGPGEVVRSADLQEIAWPVHDPVDGALSKMDEAVGRTVLYPLAPGQPLLDRELARPGSGPGLASKIPNGMRAIALRSDEVVGVAGFLVPGSHVDVLSTYHMTQFAEPFAATVLQNAEVIAAGQQTEPDPQGKAVSTTVVTLLLDPQQAERALLASSQGSLHFVLRNSADRESPTQAPITLSQLTGSPKSTEFGNGLIAQETLPTQIGHHLQHHGTEGDGVEIILGSEGSAAGSRFGADPSTAPTSKLPVEPSWSGGERASLPALPAVLNPAERSANTVLPGVQP